MKGLFLTVLVGLFLLAGCTFSDEEYKIETISVSPEVAIPLATGTLIMQDILDQTDSAYVKVYPDGLVYLSYEDELVTQDIRDLIDVPDLGSINRSLSFPPGTYPASASDTESTISTSSVDMGISPEQLTEIAFKSGDLNYTLDLVPPNAAVPFAVRIEIPEFISDATGNPFNETVSGSGSISLTGYTFKSATANTFTLKITLIIKQHNDPYVIAPGTNVNISINYTGADFRYIKGFFGDQIANAPSQSLDIGTFGDFLEDGTVSFAEPKISFEIINEYGVPVQLTFADLQARKSGSSMNILINPTSPFNIEQPAALGESAATSVAITNVNDIFNFGPSEFYYQVSGRINAGLTSGVNFMADTSKLRVKLDVELPLYGQASGIEMSDTIDLNLEDVDASQIESAEIKALITNELPLDGNIQLSLLDDNDNLIDNLLATNQTHIVKGSIVNATGDLQSAGMFDDLIVIDNAKVNKIFSAKRLVISVLLNTSKNSSGNPVDVKFKSSLTIDVKVGLKAKLKIAEDL